MRPMVLTTVFDIVFAAGVGVAALALAGAVLRFLCRSALAGLAALELGSALAAWLALALSHDHARELAVAAGGLTGCLLATSAALLLQRALVRTDAMDANLEEAQTTLRALVARETAENAAELERSLARARADSVSQLAEEERRIADEHRRECAEREREIAASLMEALTATQTQVEQRLAGWAQDLDRAAEMTKARIAELAQRQKQLISEIDVRLAADAERLATDSEEQRAAVQRLRAELDKTLDEVLAGAHNEVDTHAADRRRALHELDERLRRRERELLERVEREEGEVAQRIRSGF